jgi:hypothetical protein
MAATLDRVLAGTGQESRVRYLNRRRDFRTRNVGTRKARAGLVAFVDDAIASPNWATEIVRAFDTNGDRAGVVGGGVMTRWVTSKPAWLSDSLLG